MQSAQFISIQAKHPISSWLCINDDLPEIRHIDPDWELQGSRVGGARKARLGAGIVGCVCSTTAVDRGQTKRESVCGIGQQAHWATYPSWSPTRYRTGSESSTIPTSRGSQIQVLINYRERNVKSNYDQSSVVAKVNVHKR